MEVSDNDVGNPDVGLVNHLRVRHCDICGVGQEGKGKE